MVVSEGGTAVQIRPVYTVHTNKRHMNNSSCQASPVILSQVCFATRNMFCGTWYLPHSHVHNKRTVPIIIAGCMAHARNDRISTNATVRVLADGQIH